VSIYEAKTHLSRLVVRVEQGAEIGITRNGRLVAQLVRPRSRPTRRVGMLDGRCRVPEGWDQVTSAELADWYGQ